MPEKYALSHMDLDEISLVPAGDNDGAKTVLSKAAPDAPDKDTPMKPHAFVDAGDGTCETCGKAEDDESHMPVKKSLRDRIMDVLKADPFDKSGEGESGGDTIGSNQTQGGEATVPTTKTYEDILKSLPDDEREAIEASIEKAKTEAVEEALDALDGFDEDIDIEDDDDGSVEKVLAKADPAVRSLIEKMQADTASALAKAQAAEDANANREMISKAEALKNIPGTPEEKATLLKQAYAVSDEFGKSYEQQMKATNAMLDEVHQGAFGSFGKSAPGDLTVGTEVETKAEALRKDDPTLTKEQAIAKVFAEDPSLYDAITKEG